MEKVEEILTMGGVVERLLPRNEPSPQDKGTVMSEQEPVLRSEQRPTARGGLALIPATMNIAQAAAYIGIAKSTLYTWRTRRPGFGPRAVKAGGALRYRRSDLDAWIEAHTEALDLEPELDVEKDNHGSKRGRTPTANGIVSLSRRSRPRR